MVLKEVQLFQTGNTQVMASSLSPATINRWQQASTAVKILDAAEALFAENEFNSVTIRQITNRAHVKLALVNYHFGSKDKLIEAVLRRRMDLLNEDRLRLLRVACSRKRLSLESIVAAYWDPVAERNRKGGPDNNYCRFVMRMVVSPQYSKLLAVYLKPVHKEFFKALGRALPEASQKHVYLGYAFLTGAAISILSGAAFLKAFSNGVIDPSDSAEAWKTLIPFVTAGFRQLARSSRNNDGDGLALAKSNR